MTASTYPPTSAIPGVFAGRDRSCGRDGRAALAAAKDQPHRLGEAVRALKVFTATAFSVIVLGEYAEEAGVRTR